MNVLSGLSYSCLPFLGLFLNVNLFEELIVLLTSFDIGLSGDKISSYTKLYLYISAFFWVKAPTYRVLLAPVGGF